MTRRLVALCSTLATLALAGGLAGPAAQAAPLAPLAAPGAPIRAIPEHPETNLEIDGKNYHIAPEHSAWSCSQGPSGTVTLADGTRMPIMITAGHCVTDTEGEGSVLPEILVNTRASGFQVLGTRDRVGDVRVAADDAPIPVQINDTLNSPDWGIVRLAPGVTATRLATSRDEWGGNASAPVTLTGIRDYRTLGAFDVAVDNAGQPICKDGSRTARSCGVQLFRTKEGVWSWGLTYKQGDSGGINYDPRTGEVIGLTSMGMGPLGRTQPADAALEQAYGIPDGQVNERFQLTESTAAPAEFKTIQDEQNDLQAELEAQGLNRPAMPDFRAELGKAIASTNSDLAASAAQLQSAAASGNVDAAIDAGSRAIDVTAGHAQDLIALGVLNALNDLDL